MPHRGHQVPGGPGRTQQPCRPSADPPSLPPQQLCSRDGAFTHACRPPGLPCLALVLLPQLSRALCPEQPARHPRKSAQPHASQCLLSGLPHPSPPSSPLAQSCWRHPASPEEFAAQSRGTFCPEGPPPGEASCSPAYGPWWQGHQEQPRGTPPSVSFPCPPWRGGVSCLCGCSCPQTFFPRASW